MKKLWIGTGPHFVCLDIGYPEKTQQFISFAFRKKSTAFSLGCKVFRNSDCIPDFSRASFDWSIWDGQNQKTICKMWFFPMQIIHFSIEINGIQNSP